MAAITPEAYSTTPDIEVSVEPSVKLDDETRDKLLLKTIARVERIDSEVEILIETLDKNRGAIAGLIHDQHQVVDEVKKTRKQMETIKGLLTKVLTKVS